MVKRRVVKGQSMNRREPVTNHHEPQRMVVSLFFTTRQWVNKDWASPRRYDFKIFWTPYGGKASVDLIHCDQSEPLWASGDKITVLRLLAEIIKEQTGRETTHFDSSLIDWEVVHDA